MCSTSGSNPSRQLMPNQSLADRFGLPTTAISKAQKAIAANEIISATQIEATVRHMGRVLNGARRVGERGMFETTMMSATKEMLMRLNPQPDTIAVLEAWEQVTTLGMLTAANDAVSMMRRAER